MQKFQQSIYLKIPSFNWHSEIKFDAMGMYANLDKLIFSDQNNMNNFSIKIAADNRKF